MKLPEGTLFSYGERDGLFDDLRVKGYTLEGCPDWGERSLLHVIPEDTDALFETGISTHLNGDYGRHGLFDETLRFLVFERSDLEEMSKIINEALKVV